MTEKLTFEVQITGRSQEIIAEIYDKLIAQILDLNADHLDQARIIVSSPKS